MSDAVLSPPLVVEPPKMRSWGGDLALRLRQHAGILGASALFLALYLFYHASHPRGFTSQVLIQNANEAFDDDVDRVISYQSRLLKAAKLNYSVHDKELLSIKYALVKFRVHLLGTEPFVIYTDHASLRTAINSPHLSPRMARWLTLFSKYTF